MGVLDKPAFRPWWIKGSVPRQTGVPLDGLADGLSRPMRTIAVQGIFPAGAASMDSWVWGGPWTMQ